MNKSKISEIIEFLKEKPAEYCNFEEIAEELNIHDALNIDYYNDSSKKVCYEKGFDNWTCWDTQVGKYMIYLYDEPVAIRFKEYRKSDSKYYWFSKDSIFLMKNYIESLLPEEEYSRFNIIEDDVKKDIEIPLIADEIGDSRSANGYYKRKL